jgi:hypothetical protein
VLNRSTFLIGLLQDRCVVAGREEGDDAETALHLNLREREVGVVLVALMDRALAGAVRRVRETSERPLPVLLDLLGHPAIGCRRHEHLA